jgi:hypothetical protein
MCYSDTSISPTFSGCLLKVRAFFTRVPTKKVLTGIDTKNVYAAEAFRATIRPEGKETL